MDNRLDETVDDALKAESRLLRAKLVPAGHVLSKVAPPRVHGVYACWIESGSIPGLRGLRHPDDSSLELLYIGIASRTSSSLHARLGTHVTKTSRRSTLRLSLAYLLAPSMGGPRRSSPGAQCLIRLSNRSFPVLWRSFFRSRGSITNAPSKLRPQSSPVCLPRSISKETVRMCFTRM